MSGVHRADEGRLTAPGHSARQCPHGAPRIALFRQGRKRWIRHIPAAILSVRMKAAIQKHVPAPGLLRGDVIQPVHAPQGGKHPYPQPGYDQRANAAQRHGLDRADQGGQHAALKLAKLVG